MTNQVTDEKNIFYSLCQKKVAVISLKFKLLFIKMSSA